MTSTFACFYLGLHVFFCRVGSKPRAGQSWREEKGGKRGRGREEERGPPRLFRRMVGLSSLLGEEVKPSGPHPC